MNKPAKAFLESGPLFKACGGFQNVGEEAWYAAGDKLTGMFEVKTDQVASKPVQARIWHYYVPVYAWLADLVAKHQGPRPLFLGMSAPQGCGKTTLVSFLKKLMELEKKTTVVLSIDDFYLTGADQDAVALEHSDNALLKYRGNAGSHDLPLVESTLKELANLKRGEVCSIPQYDKSLRSGRGDRKPKCEWPTVTGPVSVVLVEGWMYGFSPLEEDHGALKDNGMAEVNRYLQNYGLWHSAMDGWLVVGVQDTDIVYQWRLEQERAMINEGKTGLTEEQVRDFVGRFMPAYKTYLPGLYSSGPHLSKGKPVLQIMVDATRHPVSSHFQSGA